MSKLASVPGVSDWQAVVERLQQACHEAGLDLVHPFGLGHLPRTAPDERLTDFGRANALGVLLGNTRELWPRFARAFATSPALQQVQHPLDAYVSKRVKGAVARATTLPHSVVLSHVVEPRPYPIQRLAERVGFAALAPCHLAIRPDHGLWFGLRAVVTFDCDGPQTPPSRSARPCDGCNAPCVKALERAVAVTPSPLSQATIREHAEAWIEVRRVCPIGQASRYGEAQLRYHYAPDPELIRDSAQGS